MTGPTPVKLTTPALIVAGPLKMEKLNVKFEVAVPLTVKVPLPSGRLLNAPKLIV